MLLLGSAIALPAAGQVVREDGAKAIAGVLYATNGSTAAEWTFKSAGGEVMFASLDADIYRIQTEEHEGEVAAAAEEPGGCSGEGGPGLFKLKVLDASGTELCSASRPAPPPGWQRDPRLACALPAMKGLVTYRLRVELANPGGESMQSSYPFLLNVSLRKIAPSGVNIQEAFAWSSSGGF
jgi:hypothetical protein